MGFVRDLVKAGSVEFVEDAVEHVGSSLLPRRLVLRGSSLMRVQVIDADRTGFMGSADIKKALHQMRILGWLLFFALPAVLASEVGYTEKRPRTSCSRFLNGSCPCNTSKGFFFGDVFLSRRHGSLHARRQC